METLLLPDTSPSAPKQTRFSFRQREFARLFAQGLPAEKAARAAGYAASTAETNAARLLNHPRVIAYIERRRDNVRTVEGPHLAALNRRLYKMILEGDEPTVLKASKEIRDLLKIQLKYGAGLVDYEGDGLLPKEAATEDEQLDIENRVRREKKGLTDNKLAQVLEDEQKQFLSASPAVEETDQLPSGESAFDVRLKPKKMEEVKNNEPITIEFHPVPSPVNHHFDEEGHDEPERVQKKRKG